MSYIISYHIISHHIISYHITSYHIISCHIILYHMKSYHIISYHIKSYDWLPIRSRTCIAFKILLLTYQCVQEMAPSYLSELLVKYEPVRNLRSSQRDLYVVPPTSTNFYGKRSFGLAAPELRNSIPNDIKHADTIEKFKTSFKTYLFKK